MERVYIFDTTLRDGEQSPGISLNVQQKLEIAEQLVKLGVDAIEAGFPITSQGDFEAVKAIADRVKGPKIVALARALDADIDRAWEAIKNSQNPCIHTFIATSDIHMERKLRKTRDEVLRMTEAAVKRARKYAPEVEFSPEDATRSNFDFLCKVLEVALENGATVINIPDTVGYALPNEFGKLIKEIKTAVPGLNNVILSVHCHNDLGLAVANSLAAVENGANQVECTINGLGERAGNAALEEIVMILDTRYRSLGKKTNIKTEEITRTSRLISMLTGYQVQFNKAIVGANAFAHSSGIHTDGVLKERVTYEIINPQKIGLTESKIILGKTSGRHALKQHLKEMGYILNEEEFEKVFVRFKELADKKAEIINDDLEAIMADEVRTTTVEIYSFKSLHVSSGTEEIPTATVRLVKNGKVIEKTVEGDGPVDAACNAISKVTGVSAKLLFYNVSSITGGLDAQGDVTIQLDIGGKKVLGRGVSTDIIEASARAYLNAINKSLTK
ncbi:2-isopropylmalate synthase [Candidatus Oleimmundimicrobium sp.]|uniref:2-isopropylmalate synthase n=1 Tax=Candidatus Oleimmundimicrobium sp. TaxID=3060597 RepID=UPI002721CB27|nr:2-isopropylmalate synthase [Candidatus Oleimmundimicrobium sp.]MDO8885790.1 2-isopropylmalate synthase [Candidatus Oleimmundimicrobium sp.]